MLCAATRCPIPSEDGYFADINGDIWSDRRGPVRKLKPWLHKGYKIVCVNGRKRPVHALVLGTFVGPCPEGMECCHRNDIKSDNHPSNLRWGTHADNYSDLVRNGKAKLLNGSRGIRIGRKINAEIAREIRRHYACGGASQYATAIQFGISQSMVAKIVTGLSWPVV